MDIKKIISKLPPGYVEDTAGMNGEQLRSEIIKAEASIREVEQAQKADEKLQGAKELVKDMVSSYNDARRAQRAKIAYSLHVLEERGELGTGHLTSDEDAVTRESARPVATRSQPAPKGKVRAA